MRDPSAAFARILSEAYQSIGKGGDTVANESLLAEVTRLIRMYAEGMKIRPIEVISTEVSGIVLTEETATIQGAARTWQGVHRWCFESGRCSKFEAYSQTLVVVPPAPAIRPDS